jgi:hypothetical protein
MLRIKRNVACFLAAISMALGPTVASSQMAMADSNLACAMELSIKVPSAENAAKQTPLIAVHGLWGKAKTWSEGSTPMSKVFESIPNMVPFYFDYEPTNDRWVTNPEVAQRLAKTIVCYSKLYGGKQVILVAHSMGGLAIREALDWAAYGTRVKDVTRGGRIITIATPHTGSLLANAEFSFWMALCKAPIGIFSLTEDIDELCRQAESGRATAGLSVNSEQLKTLPKFPEGVSVKAIAGEVKVHVCAPWGCSEEKSTGGDLTVSTSSATAEYTSIGKGDGKEIFGCATSFPAPGFSPAWYEHSNMLNAPQVQASVKSSINAYLRSITEPPKPKVTGFPVTFSGMTIISQKTWGGAMSESDVTLNLVDTTSCQDSNAACPHIYFLNLKSAYHHGQYGDNPIKKEAEDASCYVTGGPAYKPLVLKATVDIGGQQAQYYEQTLCPPEISPQIKHYVWYIKGKNILVTASDTARGAVDITTLRAVLANVAWKK